MARFRSNLASGAEPIVTRTPTKPTIVIGAINGATAIFTGIEIKESCPLIATMTGVQRIVAASGIASAALRNLGAPRSNNFSSILGARKRMPAVASTESANPGSSA